MEVRSESVPELQVWAICFEGDPAVESFLPAILSKGHRESTTRRGIRARRAADDAISIPDTEYDFPLWRMPLSSLV